MTSEKKTGSIPAVGNTMTYEIKIKGCLGAHWSDWLGGLDINHDSEGNTRLTGVIPDQAALHGILAQIRDMGLILISITPLDN